MTENCILCSRPLLDPESKTRGVGPECYSNFRRRIACVKSANLTESQAMSMLDNNDLDITVSQRAWVDRKPDIYFKTDDAPFIHHIDTGLRYPNHTFPPDAAMFKLAQCMGYVQLADDTWYRYQHLTFLHEWLDEPHWMELFNGSIHLEEVEILDLEENEIFGTVVDNWETAMTEHYMPCDAGGIMHDYNAWCYTIGGTDGEDAFWRYLRDEPWPDIYQLAIERVHELIESEDEINGVSNPVRDIESLNRWFPPGWRGSPAEAEERYLRFTEDTPNSPTDWCYTHLQGVETITRAVENWMKHSGRM